MLINKKAVKELILEKSKEWHQDQFTRVSAPVFLEIEALLTSAIEKYVAHHPKKGKTIMVYKPESV